MTKPTQASKLTSAIIDDELQVLVVEDNLANQIVTTTFISAMGAKTTVVENGLLAVNAVQESEFDMILMDIQMPVMDGVDATKHIRALGGCFNSVPIIAVTANVLPEQRDECMAAGMNDYVTKPVNRQLLMDAFVRWAPKNWLESHQENFINDKPIIKPSAVQSNSDDDFLKGILDDISMD